MDNLFYTQPATGDPVATDDVGGVHFQKMKLDGGADGQTTMITGTTEFGITADVKRLPAGSTMLGNVNVERISGFVSTNNSSTSNLNANAKFTGTADEILYVAEIQVGVFASHAPASPGLSGQFSSDGTNWDITESFTVSGQACITFEPKLKFFRVIYENGTVTQTAFRLQTIYKSVATGQPDPVVGRVQIDGISREVKWAVINAVSAGDNTIIAAKPERRFRILTIAFTCNGNNGVAFKSGANRTIIPAMQFANRGGPGLNMLPSGWFMETIRGDAFVLNLKNNHDITGFCLYVEI